ncbi:MAG: protease modulator HflK [Novosphingobium sp.]
MAGRKSPWGGGDKHGGGEPEAAGGSGSGSGDVPDETADAPSPPAAPPSPPQGPRNPWLPPKGDEPPRRSASIEDLFKNRTRGGGGGGRGGGFPGLPKRPDGRSWAPIIVGGVIALWLFATSAHQLGSTEEGIVTTAGKYSHTIGPGVSLTWPWPIQDVDVEEVTKINRFDIPEGEAEKLMLTSDQNLVDLRYFVRWNIKNLKNYKFQLQDADATVKEVAEAAMRSSVAELPLADAMSGAGRAQIEQNVRQRMQALLDAYRSGVVIQGVDLKNVDPPANVKEAFQKVTVAQQEAQRDLSNAQAYAQQVIARAQGDTAEFDKVYEQYKLAPEVTRRRLYYETMERVLSNNDKVVIESNNVTPYLPLPEVRRKTAEAQQGGGQ